MDIVMIILDIASLSMESERKLKPEHSSQLRKSYQEVSFHI